MNWQDETEPTFVGPAASLWRMAEPPEDGSPKRKAHIPTSSYLIFAPSAHPNWSWHWMGAVSLQPIEGMPPAKLHYPGAEYEVMVWALDPDADVPDPRVWPNSSDNLLRFLRPYDVVVQFHGPTFGEVPTLMEAIARGVADGILIPDSDWRRQWEVIVKKSAEHFGGHPENN